MDQVILGIGPDVSEAELAASVHNCTIDELVERKRAFAAGREQGLREAAEVAKQHRAYSGMGPVIANAIEALLSEKPA